MNHLGERFEVQEVLGHGSFGSVYLARDQERDARVAVKRLRAPEERRVQRFKREFRALSRLHHPNLITLYELLVVNGEWLLVMEPIEGRSPADAQSLRVALPGIARGLNALHGAGYLHRDLKAENVVLTPEGRAVLLDFGVLGRSGSAGEIVGNLMGVAPEQVAGQEVGPASDWYALGAMLYRALTGEAPFRGRGSQVLARKLSEEAPALPPEAQADLAELTQALLLRDPARRLEQAARLLPGLGAPAPTRRARDLFVGRAREQGALDEALERAHAGGLEHLQLRGEPGMGKSALLEAWSARQLGAVWLRCFEQDGSAYAGLDSVVETLCAKVPAAETLNEEQRGALATLFPGVGWDLPSASPDPVRTRAVAARALRQLLRAHARGGCPVLIVDDVQWGGADTGHLLAQLLEAPWLVVTATRVDAAPSGLTRALEGTLPTTATLELGPLAASEIDPAAEGAERARLTRALTQAEGHPLFLSELLHAQSTSTELLPLLRERARALPASGAQLMRVLVAAARPLDRELALSAHSALPQGGARREPFHDLTVLLRERLVRLSYSHAGSRLEPAHALIRDACAAELSVDAEVHSALDDAMERLSVDEPEHQARHARAAGRRGRAARLYEQAAERAAGSLAFARAAELYALAGDCAEHEPTRRRLRVARARALGSAGLHLRSAEAFEEALAGAPVAADSDAMSLHRQRAEHLLHAGAMKRGERALQDCLEAAGVESRRTRRGLLASILMHQAWLRTRGAEDPRPRSEAPPALELTRVDLCFSAALALTNLDTLRGMDFALRSARGAYRLGDRRRFARSYSLITAYSGSPGERAASKVTRMIERVRRFGDEFDDANLRGMAEAARCLLLFHMGCHAESLAQALRAEQIFRREAGAPREATTALIYRCANLASLGRYRELERARLELLEDSMARHDGFGETHARVGLMNIVWLIDDDPQRAEDELRRGMERWREVDFQFSHFFALLAGCRIDLYRGEPGRCLERLESASAGLAASLFLRMPYVRAQISDLTARAWLGLLTHDASTQTPGRALREARREARRIRRLGAPIYAPLADVIEAGVALHESNAEEARRGLIGALAAFEGLGLRGHAFAANHALEALAERTPRVLPDGDAPKDAGRFARALGLGDA